MQIVALAILLKKDSLDFFAQVHSFWDKWEKQHDGRKQLGLAHVFGRHVVFPTYLKNYALEQKSPENIFLWSIARATIRILCELCSSGVIT